MVPEDKKKKKKVDGNRRRKNKTKQQSRHNDSSLTIKKVKRRRRRMKAAVLYEPVTRPAFFLLRLAVKPLSPPLQIEAVHQHDNILTGSNTYSAKNS